MRAADFRMYCAPSMAAEPSFRLVQSAAQVSPNCHANRLGPTRFPGSMMRCAIYFVPPPDDPLTVAAAHWLRRDGYTGAGLASEIEGLTERDHAFLTALPRRY